VVHSYSGIPALRRCHHGHGHGVLWPLAKAVAAMAVGASCAASAGAFRTHTILPPARAAVQPDCLESDRQYPIVINSFNRAAMLAQLVRFFLSRGYCDIHVLDNNSTYPPLLAYYQRVQRDGTLAPHVRVHFLGRNLGSQALWRGNSNGEAGEAEVEAAGGASLRADGKGATAAFLGSVVGRHYAYTDPDVLPTADCPRGFLDRFREELDRHPALTKVGCALKIDDLPDSFPLKRQVLAWEAPFWEEGRRVAGPPDAEDEAVETLSFVADIDTTLALYRPGQRQHSYGPALRMGGRFAARHLPWYAHGSPSPDPGAGQQQQQMLKEQAEEAAFYRASVAEAGFWTKVTPRQLEDRISLPP
jgi:hypothetical protein